VRDELGKLKFRTPGFPFSRVLLDRKATASPRAYERVASTWNGGGGRVQGRGRTRLLGADSLEGRDFKGRATRDRSFEDPYPRYGRTTPGGRAIEDLSRRGGERAWRGVRGSRRVRIRGRSRASRRNCTPMHPGVTVTMANALAHGPLVKSIRLSSLLSRDRHCRRRTSNRGGR